jgi:hypothetical protein
MTVSILFSKKILAIILLLTGALVRINIQDPKYNNKYLLWSPSLRAAMNFAEQTYVREDEEINAHPRHGCEYF